MEKKINWSYWQKLRGAKVWEACLLSIDMDPLELAKSEERGHVRASPLSPFIFNTIFKNTADRDEYWQRIRIVCGYPLTPVRLIIFHLFIPATGLCFILCGLAQLP
jgi:hypothetical protein